MAKKLIAARPIQYMGRTYDRGDTLPAHDPRMTEAWLKHGSAKWEDTAQGQQTTAQGEGMPGAGEFCGEEELTARIVAAITEEPDDPPKALAAVHLDATMLAKLKTEDLEKLAADLGVDLAEAKTNTERAERIAAVEVLIPEAGDAQ